MEILWPLDSWVNLWEGVTPPTWWLKLMMPVENLFLALFFLLLASTARKQGTDGDFLPQLGIYQPS